MNRQILLDRRPSGYPTDDDFRIVETPLPVPGEGEVLVRTVYLSVDPYMRGRMNDVPSYAPPVGLGEVMVGEVVGRVVESRNDRFAPGDYLSGMFGWQEYAVSDGRGVRKLDPNVAPVTTALHTLGMPGVTAYFGVTDVCNVRSGETLVVSGAAGAVGTVAGQIGKVKGCRVVGIAGSDEKVDYLVGDLGYDAAVNYKKEENLREALAQCCPQGIDNYFDNVGGPVTDAVFPLLNVGATVAVCGQISVYNAEKGPVGPRLLWHLIVKRATVRGFLVMDYADRFREAISELTTWYSAGKLKYRERITEGLENAPRAFLEMMQGANIGKQLVRVSSEEPT